MLKHSTRLSQVHEAAVASEFATGQRVMTIDGLPGRILFIASSFSPGISEYQVMLDGGLGQGTYTASQLRALPADYRAGANPAPAGLLPAGVTASFETEAAEQHLASDDYPEMGTVLSDRPDPGTLISVVGLRKTAAATYGRPDDTRDEEYNGGENDTGMYWAEPGQQQWGEENLGPQEEAPPPPWAMSPILARLAQIEEARHFFGGTRHECTTINGTQVDDHGDAPEHGTVPRATDPDSYDERSTEGDGDPKWSDPVDPAHKKLFNGATVGMYPEGISAGGGPGLEIGAFTAARVPWTGHERTTLHGWADVPTGTEGDFVPSTEFTGRHQMDVPAEEVAQEELRATAARHSEVARQAVLAQLEEDYPPEALEWLHHAAVTGPHLIPLRSIDWSDRHTWTSYRQPERVSGFLDTMQKKAAKGEQLKPALVVAAPGRIPFIGDGHHRGLAQLLAGTAGHGPMGVWAYTASVSDTEGPWDTMHDKQIRAPSKNEDTTKAVGGADAPPDEVAGFQDQVDSAVDSLAQGSHDDPDNSLDSNRNSQLSADELPDNSATVRNRPAMTGDAPDNSWPMAGTHVNETGPAKTQGTQDGKRRRTRQAHLDAFVAASSSDSFRFHFTAAWTDVVAKARRIRAEGHVRITHASLGMVIGEVRGDHDIYESGIQRPPGKPQTIQHWACGCPWASFHQDKSLGARYSGRPCSHVMALQFEAQSRGMFGRHVQPDESQPSWGKTDVTVKSWPPYEGDPHKGHWTDYWLAPAASLHQATPDEKRDWDWTPEERDGWEQAPSRQATAELLAAGEDAADLFALAQLAGLTKMADQANAPWGSENVSHHPPEKPYGATEPPNPDQDPGSYGFLSAPDPDNWGSIQENSYVQAPLGNEAHKVLAPGAPQPLPGDLDYPDIGDFRENQGSFTYTDQANTAGPSTSMEARDPQGIRMEEELHDQPEPALPSTTGEDELEAIAVRNRQNPYQSVKERFRFGGTPMGDLGRETSPQAQAPSMVTQQPGMGSMDEPLSPEDPSIQTVGGYSSVNPQVTSSYPKIGTQQWSGGGADSDEVAVEPGQMQGDLDDIVASFQRSAAARQYAGGGPARSDGDIASSAREYLTKTADVLPDAEAAELISEGRGQRARNLGLLRLEGTHYEDQDDDLTRRGVVLDDFDDDVISV